MVKLLRYELKSLLRSLLPIYGAILAVALLNRMLWFFPLSLHPNDSFGGIAAIVALTVYLFLAIGVAVVTLIVVVQRFYKGLLGNEGYLMFTLPLESHQLLGSKLLGAFLVTILSGLVGIGSILILMSYPEVYQDFLAIDWASLFYEASLKMPSWPLLLLEFFLCCCLMTFSSTLLLYVSMALGHLSRHHRLLCSVIWYVVISTILSFVENIGSLLIPGLSPLLQLNTIANYLDFHLLLLTCIGYYFIQSVVFFFITNYILSHRLNLQ